MLNIMKSIIRRYWIFLLLMLVFGVISFLTGEGKASLAVLLYIGFFTLISTDLKSIAFESSLPINRKKVVDARFLLIFILLSLVMFVFIPKAMKWGTIPRFASSVTLAFIETSIWLAFAFCFGRGDGIKNLVMGMVMTVIVFLMIYVNVGEDVLIDAMDNLACTLQLVSGVLIYGIFWVISRKRIGKADI